MGIGINGKREQPCKNWDILSAFSPWMWNINDSNITNLVMQSFSNYHRSKNTKNINIEQKINCMAWNWTKKKLRSASNNVVLYSMIYGKHKKLKKLNIKLVSF